MRAIKEVFYHIFVIGAVIIVFANIGIAHDLWINARNYCLAPENSIYLTLGYGHRYLVPGTEFMPQKYLDKLWLITPDNRKMNIKAVNEVEYKSTPVNKEGTYLIVAIKKGGFFTKTINGYKRCSKKGLNNVVVCKYSEKSAKAIVNVGKSGGKTFSKPLNLKLEIIPLSNPARLRQGDYFYIKVLFKGKALAGENVFATYSGFSTKKNVFAYATKTDPDGIAKIKLLKSGIWLIVVRHNIPYPDPEECDLISCSTSLTFEVK